MKLSKPQVAELLRRYAFFLDDEPVPPADGNTKRTCKALVGLKVLTAGLSLTALGIETAQAHGGEEIPSGAGDWLETQQKAASKRARKVQSMMESLGPADEGGTDLEGDDYWAEVAMVVARLKG